MIDETSTRPRRGKVIAKRLVMLVALTITAFHLFASFLWIAPASNLRQVVPGNLLTAYMIPMWGQSWSVFAPEPINGDYYFDVRAVIKNADGEEEITQWVRATDVELTHSTYKLFPPRSAGLAISVSSNLKNSWSELSADHKVIVDLDYFKGDDSQQRLESKLEEYGDKNKVIEPYLQAERTAVAYSTQVAEAVWGDEQVLRVQFQASRKNVIPYAERNKPGAVRPDIQVVPTGWRALVHEEHQSNADFKEYFCASDEVRCVDE